MMEINSYNFVSQHVLLSEVSPNCVHVCHNDKLMIAYEREKRIKIYDLSDSNTNNANNTHTNNANNKPIITVPILEHQIRSLIHSHCANYLAILAHNQNNVKTVCVYSNYWIERQPTRRPNGVLADTARKTRHNCTIRDTLSLEVIEFNDPLIASDCQSIGCCESSANLCVCCGFRVIIYNHQRFECSSNIFRTDFVHVITVELQWFATSASLLENYLVVSSKSHASLLRIILDYDDHTSSGEAFNKNAFNCGHNNNELNFVDDCIEWDFERNNCSIRLPSMFGITDRSLIENNLNHAEEVIGPSSECICCKFSLNVNQTHMSCSICHASLQILFCRYFFSNNSVIDTKLIGYYKTAHTQTDPLNASKLSEIGSNRSIYPFLSHVSNDLIDGALVILTKQNSYCYSIVNKIELRQQINFGDNNSDTRVKSICVDKFDDTLHALTNNGLNTYSFNFIPSLNNHEKHSSSESPLKLNTRLFLNIDYLLSTKNYLLLVSVLDNDKRTIYSLRKPSLQHVYDDTIEILINTTGYDVNSKSKLNLITYLYSILRYNFSNNLNVDNYSIECYHNCCSILCNTLAESKSANDSSFEYELRIINEANITFAQLISYKFNRDIVFEFIRRGITNGNKLDITGYDLLLSDFENFLICLYDYDRVLFCQLALNQSFDDKLAQIILNLVKNDESIICQLVLTKILFNKTETENARNLLISIDEDLLKSLFCKNYCFILSDTSFTLFIEKCVYNTFYHFLLLLVKQKSSVKFVFDLISDQNITIRQKFLYLAFRNFSYLFDSDLYYELISVNINFLCNAILKPNDDTIKRIPLWFEQLPPNHCENNCYCIKCDANVAQLFLLLYITKNESVIKEKVYNLLNTINKPFEWLFTAKLLSMHCVDAIEMLLKHYPNTVLPFIKDICNSNDLIQVFDLLKTHISDIECLNANSNSTTPVLLNYTLNQLTQLLTPTQLIQLLPNSWKDFALPFVEKSIINMQAKLLKEKIINLGTEVKSSMIYE